MKAVSHESESAYQLDAFRLDLVKRLPAREGEVVLLTPKRPGLSSLVLSMVDAEGKTQDGFLRLHDIYNLKLPAELVVLSACQTGLGKEIKGEGLDGVMRGFMYAGAARVVVSLWSVNDKATSDLMGGYGLPVPPIAENG